MVWEAISLRDELPKRLKHDAIVEAVFEIRFQPDAASVPEITLGRLADSERWRGFRQTRLPVAEIPAAFRRADPNLRFQPEFELAREDGQEAVRIGPHALACSRRAPYPGWTTLGPDFRMSVDALCQASPGLTVTRLGLRYINALNSDLHNIHGVLDLNLSISVDDKNISGHVNLNFVTHADDMLITTHIATPEFVEGQLPLGGNVVADIDVYTSPEFTTNDPDLVKSWLERAHEAEKRAFFTLLKDETIERLQED